MQPMECRLPPARIPKETYDHLEDLANSLQTPLSALIRQAVLGLLDKHGYSLSKKKGGTVNE